MSDLIRSGYWPASVNADTLFSVDVFSTFEEMKTVAPGLSRQGFLRMLERRTCLFGRVRSVWIKVEMVENISVAISFNSNHMYRLGKYMETYFKEASWNTHFASTSVKIWPV